MNDYAVKFFLIVCALLDSITTHSIKTNKNIAMDDRTLGIIESDYVGIIIVGEVLTIDLEYFLVIAEDIAHFTNCESVKSSHRAQPSRCVAAAYLGKCYAFGIV